jgi:hypothetical protein
MTARTLSRLGLAAAITALACAACSSTSPSTTPSPSPSAAHHLTAEQVDPPLIQCFVNHDLIPAAALNDGKNLSPPSDSSTWIRDGKVIVNLQLGDWLRSYLGLVIKGKPLQTWILQIEANRNAWSANICGPMPR